MRKFTVFAPIPLNFPIVQMGNCLVYYPESEHSIGTCSFYPSGKGPSYENYELNIELDKDLKHFELYPLVHLESSHTEEGEQIIYICIYLADTPGHYEDRASLIKTQLNF